MSDRTPSTPATRALICDADERLVTRLRLTVVDGPDRSATATLDGDELGVGTDPGNDLVLTDTAVSRHHFVIRASAEGFLLRDVGSTNGTVVAGIRIVEAFIEPGATIDLGETRLRVDHLDQPIREPLSQDSEWAGVIGASAAMRHLFVLLPRIAASDSTVLLGGETGTGKGLIAEAIHQASPRRGGPFVIFDCGAVPPSLIESELFGHHKGAFTGATTARDGVFVAANGGTVFLDEIGELPLDLQPKLLRALEDRAVRPVGSNAQVPLDVRIIAASNRELRREVNRGTFRADLFYRLHVVRIRIPPLRERREDIPALLAHFYRQFVRDGEDPKPPLAMIRRFLERDWPGNVRELRAAVERELVFGDADPDDELEVAATSSGGVVAGASPDDDLGGLDDSYREAKERALARWELRYVHHLLRGSDGNISGAARRARMDRNHLRELIRRHGVDPKQFGSA